MIEITGMNRDKTEKKSYVENRWLPAIIGGSEKYDFDAWYFFEIAMDIRNIREPLQEKIAALSRKLQLL